MGASGKDQGLQRSLYIEDIYKRFHTLSYDSQNQAKVSKHLNIEHGRNLNDCLCYTVCGSWDIGGFRGLSWVKLAFYSDDGRMFVHSTIMVVTGHV